ncbi:DUF6884 domain-containing protein [Krasilnikovia sp. MM14-A1259]|uniref:DUF6884 domain-containing protein n=1 Tax=Krasilnikovia sp. MM14-A1259 TaxID=3373539 RepID=UPI0037FF1C96
MSTTVKKSPDLRVTLTDWTFVLAKPLRGTARGSLHVVSWRRPAAALCEVAVVNVAPDGDSGDADDGEWFAVMVDQQGPAFLAGHAQVAEATEATCRRCCSILRRLPVRAFPLVVQHTVALAENARIDAERAEAARLAKRLAARVKRAEAEHAAAVAAQVASLRATAEQIAAAGVTPVPVRQTWHAAGRPALALYYGRDIDPARPLLSRFSADGCRVFDAVTGAAVAHYASAVPMWLAPATVLYDADQLAEARTAAARIEEDVAASIRTLKVEPTPAVRYTALNHQQQLATQRGHGALALALAERVADLQEAYDAAQRARAQQRAEDHARIIAERAAAADPREVVVIPCGSRKLDRPAPAGEMYVGSYHRACARAAATRGGRVLIISAKFGLLDPSTVIEPYDLRMGQRGSVTAKQVREQAARLGVLDAPRVTVMAGRAYVALASQAWGRNVEQPLGGTRGIGQQMARLALLAITPRNVRGRDYVPPPPPAGPRFPGQLALFDVDAAAVRGRRAPPNEDRC